MSVVRIPFQVTSEIYLQTSTLCFQNVTFLSFYQRHSFVAHFEVEKQNPSNIWRSVNDFLFLDNFHLRKLSPEHDAATSMFQCEHSVHSESVKFCFSVIYGPKCPVGSIQNINHSPLRFWEILGCFLSKKRLLSSHLSTSRNMENAADYCHTQPPLVKTICYSFFSATFHLVCSLTLGKHPVL